MATYTIGVTHCLARAIRSISSDTLVASMGLRVMNAEGALHQDWSPLAAKLGDFGPESLVPTNLVYQNVDVPDATPALPDGGAIYWSFILTNSGHSDSAFVAVANKAADAFAGALAGHIIEHPDIPSFLGLAAVLGAQELLNLLTANCDGVVAVLGLALTARELVQMTADPANWLNQINCPGTDSSVGCGGNSNYDVSYFIADRALTTVPRLIGQSPQRLSGLAQNAGLYLSTTSSRTGGLHQVPQAESQTPAPGTQVQPATWVEATVIYPPARGHLPV
jgi:hypothetical protein